MEYHYPFTSESTLREKLGKANLLTSRVEAALELAKKAHRFQKRDQGNNYLEEHIYTIAAEVLGRYTNDPELEDILILGILHDVLEDDPSATSEDIEKYFGRAMRENLGLLTKKPEDNTNELSQEKKRAITVKVVDQLRGRSRLAQIIRLEDRLNNLRSIKEANKPKYERYCEETKNIFIPFAKEYVPIYEPLLLAELKRLRTEE